MNNFNPLAELPCKLNISQIELAMNDCISVLSNYDEFGVKNDLPSLKDIQTPAGYSSMISEMMIKKIAARCNSLVQNKFHNGHPDLIPANIYSNDSVQKGDLGVEIKASKSMSGWQGHNPEDVFLMVFIYEINPNFKFKKVYGANLLKEDWTFSGRKEGSRRTITASINKSGMGKMRANWIFDSEINTNLNHTMIRPTSLNVLLNNLCLAAIKKDAKEAKDLKRRITKLIINQNLDLINI